MILNGIVVRGCGHFTHRMATFPDVFYRATGESLFPGTLNVDVGRKIRIKEDFRIPGIDIDEPEQDLLFEKCLINEIPSYRIRPYHLTTGEGGHGDHILEIACANKIPNVGYGTSVEIRLFREISCPLS
jgi:CTP-dependent riboflavin kinase